MDNKERGEGPSSDVKSRKQVQVRITKQKKSKGSSSVPVQLGSISKEASKQGSQVRVFGLFSSFIPCAKLLPLSYPPSCPGSS